MSAQVWKNAFAPSGLKGIFSHVLCVWDNQPATRQRLPHDVGKSLTPHE